MDNHNADIMLRWRQLVAACDERAAECIADPEAAALNGLEPEYEPGGDLSFVVFGGRGERHPQSDKAAWIRAVARKLIDEKIWNYRVVEVVGGGAFLALISFNGDVGQLLDQLLDEQ